MLSKILVGEKEDFSPTEQLTDLLSRFDRDARRGAELHSAVNACPSRTQATEQSCWPERAPLSYFRSRSQPVPRVKPPAIDQKQSLDELRPRRGSPLEEHDSWCVESRFVIPDARTCDVHKPTKRAEIERGSVAPNRFRTPMVHGAAGRQLPKKGR